MPSNFDAAVAARLAGTHSIEMVPRRSSRIVMKAVLLTGKFRFRRVLRVSWDSSGPQKIQRSGLQLHLFRCCIGVLWISGN